MVPRGLSLIRIRLPGFRLALSDPVGGDILHRDPSFPAKEGDGSENVSEPALPLVALFWRQTQVAGASGPRQQGSDLARLFL